MKTIFKIAGTLLFVTSFSVAASNSIGQKSNAKNLLIPADSAQGQIILKTEQEYRKYLDKKISKAEFEKELFIATKKNCQDVYLLKRAIVKIIGKLNKLEHENEFQNKIIKDLQVKLDQLQKQKLSEKDLSEVSKKIKESMQQNVEKVGAAAVTNSAVESIVKASKELSQKILRDKVKPKNICTKKEIVVGFDKNKIKESYIKFSKPREFTVIGKYVYLYDYPLLKFTKKVGKLTYGTRVMGDMYTKAGWIHINDKDKNVSGWVKGYLMYPKVLYSLKNPSIENSAFIRKDIVECTNKKDK